MTTPRDLFGTDEPPPARRTLRAGALSAVLEGGQLRDLRWHGVEALRGIAYLLRDAHWGTLTVALSGLRVEEGPDVFTVAFGARADAPAGRLAYEGRIEGRAEGRLSFEVKATAETEFVTSRTGFVALHPDHVAGLPLEVGHPDGTVERTAFPARIAPGQPAREIASLAHAPAPGVAARVTFTGGIWEMEDQRNWGDASFKTYVRPLRLPRPYAIPAGATDRQSVVLDLSGQPAPPAAAASPLPPEAEVPPLWLRLAEAEPVPAALPLRPLAHGLIARLRGGAPNPARLGQAAALARAEGLALGVEAILPCRDPAAEAQALLAALRGHAVEALLVAGERDEKQRPSGPLPEGEAPLDAVLLAIREAGFAGRLGAGTPAFFTELNRNPPPAADLVFWGNAAIVHAADDCSVMETAGVLPAILASARALAPGAEPWPGPLAIAPAASPYAPALARTDGSTRTCMAERDPRHGALFGAAHLVAVLAAAMPLAGAVAPLFASGPSGLVDGEGRPLPLAFVHAEAARARGARLRPPPPRADLATLAWSRDGRRSALLANLSPEPVELPHSGPARAARLAPGPRGWEPVAAEGALRLAPFATLRVEGPDA